jgi:hypothetical protein
MSTILFLISLTLELEEKSERLETEEEEEEGEEAGEEFSCAMVNKGLMPINGESIKIPIKNEGRIIFLSNLI